MPSFLYGPLPGGRTRTLPDVRRHAFAPTAGLTPDFGPARPDPRAGATAVGARRVLVAYNVWVSSLEVARLVAPRVRRPHVRALALAVGDRAQVSCNLIEPDAFGPAQLYDAVAALAAEAGGAVEGAELVGLVPEVVLAAVPPARWPELGLSAEATVESRLALRGAGDVAAGQGPGTAEAAALPLAHAAPDTELLAVRQGVLEAVLPDDAAPADLLGLAGRRAPLGKEQVRVDAHAVCL